MGPWHGIELAWLSKTQFNMRNILFSITLFLFLIPSVRAQEKLDFDPDLAWNTLRAEYGAVIPVGTVSNKSFGHFSLSYTRRYWAADHQAHPLAIHTVRRLEFSVLSTTAFRKRLRMTAKWGLNLSRASNHKLQPHDEVCFINPSPRHSTATATINSVDSPVIPAIGYVLDFVVSPV